MSGRIRGLSAARVTRSTRRESRELQVHEPIEGGAGIEFDQEVHVARRVRLIAGERPEQRERSHAEAPQIRGTAA